MKVNQSVNFKNNLASTLTIITGTLFLLLLLVLHFIKPEINPSWRMISEYEIGNYGWVMHLNFILFAISTFSFFLFIKPKMNKISGKTGKVLLLIITIGIIMGALFKSGAITTPRNEMDEIAILHNIGGFLAIFFIPFASTFISINFLNGKNKNILNAFVIIFLVLIWISFITFVIINVSTYKGVGGPNSPIGWPNRSLIISYILWLIIISLQQDKIIKSIVD